ncbi:ATP-binding protein [Rhizobium leguminosarum]|uniref:AAA family ATPase n=1 Tax=Rhizobium leguminosarum TaxID=384 RepID=UPI001C955224|nr:AAA family ATPase [Rhizobium leguminosarum]MBY5399449.1 ATP-binding protein [Rhizobium leguminosarum]
MFFRLLTTAIPVDAKDCAYLVVDNWDDWFSFRTMFTVLVIDEAGVRHQVGSVKIGRIGLLPGREIKPGQRAPELYPEFDQLPETHFSLGQGEDYYESLNKLSDAQRQKMLVGLRDVAFNLTLFDQVRNEPSMATSLLRSVSATSITGRLHRLTTGDAELTKFSFLYTLPPSIAPEGMVFAPPTMSFEVVPDSEPPSNVHVLIGRNGVGKTRAMKGLIKALLDRHDKAPDSGGQVIFNAERPGEGQFSSLVLVSFSAFDDFAIVPAVTDPIPIEQVGLRDTAADADTSALKIGKALSVDFRKSLDRCRTGLRASRWREAVATLEADDLFAEAEIGELLGGEGEDWAEATEERFGRLSSGHAIVLLTITRLVELVDERTLVMIDEPEGHLHPPLLSAFIRSLSRLLVSRNGVAIVATHSPVVLQEVPRSCAWKLRRSGRKSEVERPTIETFGENVGILTREVFSLEVTRTGFHRLLVEAVFERKFSYDQAVAQFGDQLGTEAKAIIRALVLERDRQ